MMRGVVVQRRVVLGLRARRQVDRAVRERRRGRRGRGWGQLGKEPMRVGLLWATAAPVGRLFLVRQMGHRGLGSVRHAHRRRRTRDTVRLEDWAAVARVARWREGAMIVAREWALVRELVLVRVRVLQVRMEVLRTRTDGVVGTASKVTVVRQVGKRLLIAGGLVVKRRRHLLKVGPLVRRQFRVLLDGDDGFRREAGRSGRSRHAVVPCKGLGRRVRVHVGAAAVVNETCVVGLVGRAVEHTRVIRRRGDLARLVVGW